MAGMDLEKPPIELVPTQFAASLVRVLGARGIDPLQAMRASGIDFDVLDLASPGYRNEIPALAYSGLYRHVMTALQDESFGLRRWTAIKPGAFRMMCYTLLGCADLGRAIRRMIEFHEIFYDGSLGLDLQLLDGLARLSVHVAPEPGASLDARKAMSAPAAACALSMWHRFCGWLIGHPLPLERVDLSGETPASLERYLQLFACQPEFGATTPSFDFPLDYLAYPLVHNEDSLHDFLRSAPYQLLIMPADSGRQSLVDQVRSLIGHDFSRGFPSFERITDLLHMSAPTLRRRLKREGTTFQELKDDCRRKASIDYLNRPELSINDVAILMGFTDPSAFYRSFKKWTGMTPGEFRATASLGAPT